MRRAVVWSYWIFWPLIFGGIDMMFCSVLSLWCSSFWCLVCLWLVYLSVRDACICAWVIVLLLRHIAKNNDSWKPVILIVVYSHSHTYTTHTANSEKFKQITPRNRQFVKFWSTINRKKCIPLYFPTVFYIFFKYFILFRLEIRWLFTIFRATNI